MSKIIRVKIPRFDNQKQIVIEALSKNFLDQGPHLDLLSEVLARIFKKKYVFLTNSCFSSLFLSLISLKLKPKTTIACPSSSTCFSICNAVMASGNKLNFYDMDIETFGPNLSFLKNAFNNSKSKVIIAPNHFGLISNSIIKFSNFGQYLIDDSAQSFISRSKIQINSELTALSFYPTKIVNGINGGALLTDNYSIYREIVERGSYSNQYTFNNKSRFNLKMSNINAAFTLATLENIEIIEKKLLQIYFSLYEIINSEKFSVRKLKKYEIPSKFIIKCRNKTIRDKLLKHFLDNYIEASLELLWICPDNLQKLYPNSKEIIDTTLSIPFYYDLTKNEINYIKEVFMKFEL